MIAADFCAYGFDAVFNDIAGSPKRLAAANFQYKTAEYASALLAVRDFRMKLQADRIFFLIGDAGDRRAIGTGDELKAVGNSTTRSPWLIQTSSRP